MKNDDILNIASHDFSDATFEQPILAPAKSLESEKCLSSRYQKWYVLLLASIITFGGYYSFDFPSVTHNQLNRHFSTTSSYEGKERIKEFEFEFNLLFSLYSLPNAVLPLIGGIAIDKMGNNVVILITASLVLAGNVLQTCACYQVNMTFFLLGRFLFGLGAECLQVSANIIISKWFNGMELAFAMALNLSCCKLAGVLTDWLSPYFEAKYGVNTSSLIVSMVCLICYFGAILLIFEEMRYNDRNLATSPSSSTSTPSKLSNHISTGLCQDVHFPIPATIDVLINLSSKSSSKTIQASSHPYYQCDESVELIEQEPAYLSPDWINEVSRESTLSDLTVDQQVSFSLEQRRSSTKNNSRDLLSQTEQFSVDVHLSPPQTVKQQLVSIYQDLLQLSPISWCLFCLTFLMYGTFIPFSNISNSILLEVFYMDEEKTIDTRQFEVVAARLQSIPYLLTVFATPVLGMMVDWYGHRTIQLFIAAICLFVAHVGIYTASIGALVPLMMIGLSYSIFGSVSWPCVPLIVEQNYHGTAYGLMAAFQNSAQFIIPLILAETFIWTETYRSYELCFFVTSFAAMLISLYIWYLDEIQGQGALRQPSPMKQSE